MRNGAAIGLPLALGSTILVSLSYLREHDAAAGLPALSPRRPVHSAMLLLRSRAWVTGFAMESGGFVLYVAALALAPLALVQSVAAGGVGILAVATARLARRRLSRREAAGASLAVIGLVLLAVSLGGGDVHDGHGSLGPILVWLAVTAGAGVLTFTSGWAFLGRGVADGIAGGLFFAVGDISTKLATQGGIRLLFVIPLICGYLLGTSLLQIGYQSGAALTVAGLATLLTNAVPIAAGTVVLGEHLPSGGLGVVRALAFAAVTIGAILLARPEPAKPRAKSDAPQSLPQPATL
ncbi:MAG TPA: hypothetical protein VMU90_10445 [Solirubrobacteraceae bacterium]|nr:hypothetical protein [Solirubrobacteraceae bacterium]